MKPDPPENQGKPAVLAAYQRLISSDRLRIRLGVTSFHLIQADVFQHLWFLWFLCWLVPLFAVVAWSVQRSNWVGVPPWLILSPARFLWLIPLTLVPQYFMGISAPRSARTLPLASFPRSSAPLLRNLLWLWCPVLRGFR